MGETLVISGVGAAAELTDTSANVVVASVEGDRPAPNAVAPCKCGNPGVVLHVVRKIVAAPAREHP